MAVRSRKKKDRKRVSARNRAETHKTGFERTTVEVGKDVSFFTLDREGTKRIDILPYVVNGDSNPFADDGELHFERTFFVHRGIGPNQESFVCPAKTLGKKCPICEYLAELRRDPEGDADLIKDLKAKERQLWNVIDLSEKDKGVQIWDISFFLFGELLDDEVRNADEDEDYEFFADLDGGQTLKLGVKQKSFGKADYYEVTTIGFKARQKPYGEGILKETHCLDEILKVLSYDALKAIFLQEEVDEDEDQSEPEKKPKPARKAKPKSKPVKEDEEDDDDLVTDYSASPRKATKPKLVEEEEDDDDLVTDYSASPRKATKPKLVEEEEDDDDWPEDDDAAESSPKSNKADEEEDDDDNWDEEDE